MTLVDIPTAAVAVGAPVSTVRRWISCGWLTKYGTKPYRVDIDELATLAERLGRK